MVISVNMLLLLSPQNPGEAHFFARKFEAIVNQQVITDLDAHLYGSQLAETPGVNSYWENVFHDDDDVTKPSSARYTVYNSFMSLGHKLMLKKEAGNQSESSTCPIPEHPILEEVTVYRQNDKFVGFVVTFGEVSPRLAEEEEGSYMFEVLVSPVSHFKQTTKTNSDVQARVTSIEVGSQLQLKSLSHTSLFSLSILLNLYPLLLSSPSLYPSPFSSSFSSSSSPSLTRWGHNGTVKRAYSVTMEVYWVSTMRLS